MNDHRDAMGVCLYSGLNVSADAISSSMRLKMRVLDELGQNGLPLEVIAFVQGTDDPDPRVVTTPSPYDVISHPAFGAADVHVFEFGIAYDLFDLAFVASRLAATTAVYHNVTPADLVDDKHQGAIERSMRQRYNLFAVDHVACVSELNRLDLVELGIPEDRLSVLPLPPTILAERPRDRFSEGGSGPLRALYVGRLVRAKGILDLLDALESALRRAPDIRLTIVGNEELSEPSVVAEIRRRISQTPLAGHADLLGRLDDDALAEVYARADVLVMPSYHEGYCVPVVEAFASGAYVVAYDAANLPHVVAGYGSLVPTGDVTALAEALTDLASRFSSARERGDAVVLPTNGGEMNEQEWRNAVAGYVAGHSFPVYWRRFAGLLAALVAGRSGDRPVWLDRLEAMSGPLVGPAPSTGHPIPAGAEAS